MNKLKLALLFSLCFFVKNAKTMDENVTPVDQGSQTKRLIVLNLSPNLVKLKYVKGTDKSDKLQDRSVNPFDFSIIEIIPEYDVKFKLQFQSLGKPMAKGLVNAAFGFVKKAQFGAQYGTGVFEVESLRFDGDILAVIFDPSIEDGQDQKCFLNKALMEKYKLYPVSVMGKVSKESNTLRAVMFFAPKGVQQYISNLLEKFEKDSVSQKAPLSDIDFLKFSQRAVCGLSDIIDQIDIIVELEEALSNIEKEVQENRGGLEENLGFKDRLFGRSAYVMALVKKHSEKASEIIDSKIKKIREMQAQLCLTRANTAVLLNSIFESNSIGSFAIAEKANFKELLFERLRAGLESACDRFKTRKGLVAKELEIIKQEKERDLMVRSSQSDSKAMIDSSLQGSALFASAPTVVQVGRLPEKSSLFSSVMGFFRGKNQDKQEIMMASVPVVHEAKKEEPAETVIVDLAEKKELDSKESILEKDKKQETAEVFQEEMTSEKEEKEKRAVAVHREQSDTKKIETKNKELLVKISLYLEKKGRDYLFRSGKLVYNPIVLITKLVDEYNTQISAKRAMVVEVQLGVAKDIFENKAKTIFEEIKKEIQKPEEDEFFKKDDLILFVKKVHEGLSNLYFDTMIENLLEGVIDLKKKKIEKKEIKQAVFFQQPKEQPKEISRAKHLELIRAVAEARNKRLLKQTDEKSLITENAAFTRAKRYKELLAKANRSQEEESQLNVLRIEFAE